MTKENDEASKSDRVCASDEIWVCNACGKWVAVDRYYFRSASCVLNAFKVKKALCKFNEKGDRVDHIDADAYVKLGGDK